MQNGKCLRRGFRRQLFVRALKISGLRFGKRSAGAAARLDAAVPALLCERDAQVENQFAFRLKAFAVYRRNRVCAAAGSKRAPAEHEHFAGGGDRILKREPVHVQHGEVSAGDQKPVQLRRQHAGARVDVEARAVLRRTGPRRAGGGKIPGDKYPGSGRSPQRCVPSRRRARCRSRGFASGIPTSL